MTRAADSKRVTESDRRLQLAFDWVPLVDVLQLRSHVALMVISVVLMRWLDGALKLLLLLLDPPLDVPAYMLVQPPIPVPVQLQAVNGGSETW